MPNELLVVSRRCVIRRSARRPSEEDFGTEGVLCAGLCVCRYLETQADDAEGSVSEVDVDSR